MTAAVGTMNSNTITFKNPFSQDIQVKIELKGDNDTEESFQLLTNKNKTVTIQADGIIQLLIRFAPKLIKTYHARLQVILSKQIQWVYPLKGVTEAITFNKDIVLKTQCGKELEK